jgi:ABC-type arginine transport system permease subunit
MLIACVYLTVTTVSLAMLAWLNRRFSLGVREVRLS